MMPLVDPYARALVPVLAATTTDTGALAEPFIMMMNLLFGMDFVGGSVSQQRTRPHKVKNISEALDAQWLCQQPKEQRPTCY